MTDGTTAPGGPPIGVETARPERVGATNGGSGSGFVVKGVPVSPGVVVGSVYRIEPIFGGHEPHRLAPEESVSDEVSKFDRALETSGSELEGIVTKVAQQLGGAESAIFRSHLQIVRDPVLKKKVHAHIAGERYSALSALQMVLQEYAAAFASSEHEFFRERLADIRDVVARIGSHLTLPVPTPDSEPCHDSSEPVVLVAHELLPSQAMSLGDMAIAGIVTETGGATSHAAILARSRGIPAVSGVEGLFDRVEAGDPIVVDGRDGVVLVRPDAEATSAYRKLQRDYVHLNDRLILNRDEPAVSRDGVPVEILANINTIGDVRAAVAVGAAGVGLFRTEFLFLTHHDVPDEEEQYRHYRQVIEESPTGHVTIRTLDLGGDKTVSYIGRRYEANPFMGWRSIRLSLEHPRLFSQQIRAILRAARHGKQVNMLFPMITTLDELREVNRIVKQCKAELETERVPFAPDVKCGVMIEVPAAALCIDALLRETDFISVGSNDLVQYLVAADRDNPKVAHLCEPLAPAIFRLLQIVFASCGRTGTPVTVCGEMAGQARAALVLFGMGLRRFSMSPAFIPRVKALLSMVTTAQAERYAHQVLQLKTSGEIRTYLADRLREISSDLEAFEI